MCCCVLFCCLVCCFFFPKPHKQKKKSEEKNVLESIQEKDVLSKVAVLSWRNFCCCAGRREVVTSFFMCLVLSCHLFVPLFHCSVIQASSKRVRMTHFGNATAVGLSRCWRSGEAFPYKKFRDRMPGMQWSDDSCVKSSPGREP